MKKILSVFAFALVAAAISGPSHACVNPNKPITSITGIVTDLIWADSWGYCGDPDPGEVYIYED